MSHYRWSAHYLYAVKLSVRVTGPCKSFTYPPCFWENTFLGHFSYFHDDCRVPWEPVPVNVLVIPNLWHFHLYSINFSYNARIFPLYAALCVTMRAIWADACIFRHYNARLLILCFCFHISLVAKFYSLIRFLTSHSFTFYPATSTLLKMSGEDDGEIVDPNEPNHDPDDSEPHHHSINPW